MDLPLPLGPTIELKHCSKRETENRERERERERERGEREREENVCMIIFMMIEMYV